MNRIYCWLVLAALPAHGQVGSIALYYQFQQQPPKAVFDSLKQEVASILSPAGLRFQWKSLPATGNDVTSDLAVVSFKGRCDTTGLLGSLSMNDRLGWSHISDGVVLPFAGIDCDNIRGFLRKKMADVPGREMEKVLGRAIGRVLVHELDHIFAKTAAHGVREVDHANYTAEELLADKVMASEHHILRTVETGAKLQTDGSPRVGHSVFVDSGCSACHGVTGEGSRRGPALRVAGRLLNPVMLAARLARGEETMSQRARSLKVPPPQLSESEIQDLVLFLNTPPPQ